MHDGAFRRFGRPYSRPLYAQHSPASFVSFSSQRLFRCHVPFFSVYFSRHCTWWSLFPATRHVPTSPFFLSLCVYNILQLPPFGISDLASHTIAGTSSPSALLYKYGECLHIDRSREELSIFFSRCLASNRSCTRLRGLLCTGTPIDTMRSDTLFDVALLRNIFVVIVVFHRPFFPKGPF